MLLLRGYGVVLFSSKVDEVDVDGRIDRCFARHKMVNPVMYNGEKQPERIETGALGVCGHIPVQECFAQ